MSENNNKRDKIYRKESPLAVKIRNICNYLVMALNYNTKDIVKIDMHGYIKIMLKGPPNKFRGIVVTPEAYHHFTINNNYKKKCRIRKETWFTN